jgi:hypothetical protein
VSEAMMQVLTDAVLRAIEYRTDTMGFEIGGPKVPILERNAVEQAVLEMIGGLIDARMLVYVGYATVRDPLGVYSE